LVDLLLVLGDREADIGVLEDEAQLRRHGILVERHRDASEHLSGHHRPVQPRAVVSHDRETVAAPETLDRQAAGERADFIERLRPGPGLPDPQILLADSRTIGTDFRLVQHQTREGPLQIFRHALLLWMPAHYGKSFAGGGEIANAACAASDSSPRTKAAARGRAAAFPSIPWEVAARPRGAAAPGRRARDSRGDPSAAAGG